MNFFDRTKYQGQFGMKQICSWAFWVGYNFKDFLAWTKVYKSIKYLEIIFSLRGCIKTYWMKYVLYSIFHHFVISEVTVRESVEGL